MKDWNDLANYFSLWAWGKHLPNNVSDLEKVMQRFCKEIADKKYKIEKR